MAKGDQSAPIPGLAKFLSDAKGEVKDLSKQIKELEKGFKKAKTLSKGQAQELDALYKRRDALKYQLKHDADFKRAAADVKFLRAIAIGQGVRSILSGRFSPTDLAQVFLQPGVMDSLASKLTRAGKIGRFADTRAGSALAGAGKILGFAAKAALPVAVGAEIVGGTASAIQADMDEEDRFFNMRAESRQRRMALQRNLQLDPETIAQMRAEIEPAVREAMEKEVLLFVSNTGIDAQVEAATVKRLEKIAKRVSQARGLGDFEVNALTEGSQLANLTGQESEKERDAILARLALSKTFTEKLDAMLADEALEKKRLEKHRREASPSVLYKETMQEQLEHAHFAARRTVIRQPSWLPEVNYD